MQSVGAVLGLASTAIACVWTWIGENQAPLTVFLTLGGVLVAWRYVVLTHRLAKAAKDQAEASRMAAQAAADQARTTRLLFDAQQPFLRIDSAHEFVEGPTPMVSDHMFTFWLENHGTIAAAVTSWHLGISQGDEVIRETHKAGFEVGIEAVPPKTTSPRIPALTEQVPHMFRSGEGEPVEVAAKVIYEGLGGKTYVSRLRCVLTVTSKSVRYVTTDLSVDEA